MAFCYFPAILGQSTLRDLGLVPITGGGGRGLRCTAHWLFGPSGINATVGARSSSKLVVTVRSKKGNSAKPAKPAEIGRSTGEKGEEGTGGLVMRCAHAGLRFFEVVAKLRSYEVISPHKLLTQAYTSFLSSGQASLRSKVTLPPARLHGSGPRRASGASPTSFFE